MFIHLFLDSFVEYKFIGEYTICSPIFRGFENDVGVSELIKSRSVLKEIDFY